MAKKGNLMSIIDLLHNLLKEALPSIHAARLRSLMAAVEAGLSGASVSITALGRALSGRAYIKHKIKRMDRLAGNRHLQTERIGLYGTMTRWLLQSLPMPLILIDWSPLTADQNHQLIRAALPTGGRSITLYEEIHPCKKLGNRRVQQQFLTRLQKLLPPWRNAHHRCRFGVSYAVLSRGRKPGLALARPNSQPGFHCLGRPA